MSGFRLAASIGVAAVAGLCVATTALAASDGPASSKPGSSGADTDLPDWSGIWENANAPTGPVHFASFDLATADPPNNIGAEPGDRIHPPYNAKWEAKYTAYLREQVNGKFYDPLTFCLPAGFPRIMGEPDNLEIVVTPRQTWIIFEQNSQVRRIYTDGRSAPPQEDLFPMWNGYSVGHWERQTLVVETTSLKAGQIGRSGAPYSDDAKVSEHIRQLDADTIEIEMVIVDPVTMTRPWNVKRYWRRVKDPGVFILDWACAENNRAVVNHGVTELLYPGDPRYKSPDEPRDAPTKDSQK